MLRIRRRQSRSGISPVAAEVLELRDLLSSAAAAVHGATHHAAVQHSPGSAAQLAPQSLHATVHITFTVQSGIGKTYTGQFSLSKVNFTIGSHVTAHFSVSNAATGNRGTVKGSFVGTITNAGVIPEGTLLTINPTGGSVTEHAKKPGGGSFTAKAVPNGTPTLLVMSGNTFFSMEGTDVFPSGAPGGLGGKTLQTEIEP